MPVERQSLTIGSAELNFETGRIAKQAHGSCLVTMGETIVLSTVCAAPEARPGQNFFPLTVDYREKSSAAGKIPGNFFRREARPSEREILVCRLTDRPLRPLFPKGFLNEVQVSSTVYSADNINDPDVLSINGASAALHLSQCPFDGPIGAVRVGLFGDEFVVNPPMHEMEQSDLDLVVAGTRDAIMMVEGSALEISEAELVDALEFGHGYIKKICDALDQLRERAGKPKMEFEAPALDPEAVAAVEQLTAARFSEIMQIQEKHARAEALEQMLTGIGEQLQQQFGEERYAELEGDIKEAFEESTKKLMRRQVIESHTRIDNRGLDEIRPISIEVGVLPRVHGSALFTRGETQALVSTTLGTSRDEQKVEELTGEEFRRFILHYNFPPWSVGEVKRIMGPGRREIGHGKLAERALESVLPFYNDLIDENIEEQTPEFPYTIRLLSDITESNGSSSMATVCGGTLSLMDAGVPITAPVGGVAMGLIKEGDQSCVLSDILGTEDHLGDMDFKVCGTREGITAFQMDIKISGITRELMQEALEQARQGRLFILDRMTEALAAPRTELSQYAPSITTIHIDVEKIRDIIGPGGKIVRDIQKQSGAEIAIEDDGTIHIAAVDKAAGLKALEMIQAIIAEPEVGEIYKGHVSRILNFGAFVTIMGGKEGLVHISELAPGHVKDVTDVVKIGDEIDVKVIEIDSMGRINLSKVKADIDLGRVSEEEMKEASASNGGERGPSRDRGSGGRDRGGPKGGRGGRGSSGGGGGDKRQGKASARFRR